MDINNVNRLQYIKDRNRLIPIASRYADKQSQNDDSSWNIIFHATMDKLYADLKKNQTKTERDKMEKSKTNKSNKTITYAKKNKSDTKTHYGYQYEPKFYCGKPISEGFEPITDASIEATCIACKKIYKDMQKRQKIRQFANQLDTSENTPIANDKKQKFIEKINKRINFWTQLKLFIENGDNKS